MFFSNPERDVVYDTVIGHVGNPHMIKTKVQDGYAVYMVEVQSMLLNEKRFLVVLTTDSQPVGHTAYLSDLKWISFQARTLSEAPSLDIPVYSYMAQRGASSTLQLRCKSRSNAVTVYRSPDLEVSLLHTRGGEYEYPNDGSLASAIETYQTVIRFV
jgi:hypothetical protein